MSSGFLPVWACMVAATTKRTEAQSADPHRSTQSTEARIMHPSYRSQTGPGYVLAPRRQSMALSPDPSSPRMYRSPTTQSIAGGRDVHGRSPTYSPAQSNSGGELVPLFPRSAMSPTRPRHGFGGGAQSGFSPARYSSRSLSPAVHSPSASSRTSRYGSSSEQGGSGGLSLHYDTEMATSPPRRGLSANATGFWVLALAIVATSSSIALIATLMNRAAAGQAALLEEWLDEKAELSLRLRTPTQLPEDRGVVLRFTPRIHTTTRRIDWRTPPFFSVTMRPRLNFSIRESPTDSSIAYTDLDDLTSFPETVTIPPDNTDDDYITPLPIPETVKPLQEELSSTEETENGVASNVSTSASKPITLSEDTSLSETVASSGELTFSEGAKSSEDTFSEATMKTEDSTPDSDIETPDNAASSDDTSSEATAASQGTIPEEGGMSPGGESPEATAASQATIPGDGDMSSSGASPDTTDISEGTIPEEGGVSLDGASPEVTAASQGTTPEEGGTSSEGTLQSTALADPALSSEASALSEASSAETATTAKVVKDALLVPDDYDDNNFGMLRSVLRAPRGL